MATRKIKPKKSRSWSVPIRSERDRPCSPAARTRGIRLRSAGRSVTRQWFGGFPHTSNTNSPHG